MKTRGGDRGPSTRAGRSLGMTTVTSISASVCLPPFQPQQLRNFLSCYNPVPALPARKLCQYTVVLDKAVSGLNLMQAGFAEVNSMKPCRQCAHTVSEDAVLCPNCGAPFPAKEKWDGYGFEYKSAATLFGLPLLHVSFKYRPNRVPVPAKGIIAIGQFGCGLVTIAQFGIGVISVCQFTIAGFALAQFAFAYSLIAQMGIFIHQGRGQLVRSLASILRLFS